jgi:hypothetical protein
MEAPRYFETLVSYPIITQHHKTEALNLNLHRSEDLTSHNVYKILAVLLLHDTETRILRRHEFRIETTEVQYLSAVKFTKFDKIPNKNKTKITDIFHTG